MVLHDRLTKALTLALPPQMQMADRDMHKMVDDFGALFYEIALASFVIKCIGKKRGTCKDGKRFYRWLCFSGWTG